jgi:upstream activation factor subunit UAF30
LVKSEVRSLEKHVTKELKTLDKLNAKKNKNKGNRAPSGFVKPTKISVELADFLGKPHGTLMARTDVTKQMTTYIRANSLQDKANGRIILPDTKLRKLLKLGDKDALTYFNLQKYMSPHFEKSV